MSWRGRYEKYNKESFRKDVIAGFIVGIIAIPLGMAFAISSGVKPEYGIYSTVIAGILISLFGGSRFQIGGPTGAFIPILLSIVMQYGYDNLLIAGFLAGLFLIIMGIFKLGNIIQFIPKPLTVGFTSGIAVIIFTGQIVNFLGLQNIENHEEFILNMFEIGIHIETINIYSLVTAIICLYIIFLSPKLFPRIPGSLIGLIISTFIAFKLFSGEVPTIGSTFGNIPGGLPEFHLLEINWQKIEMLLGPAFVIAMLGGIESLFSAVVADGMTGVRHNSNKELIGQGVANIITPLFGGIPATGAIARTAANIKNGAVSPISGIVHGLVVLLVLLLFAPYASHIPLASMAPILMIVAWNMSERKEFIQILKTKSSDIIIMASTFFLTVFLNLTSAIGVGLLLSVIIFVKRMSELLTVKKVLPDHSIKHKKLKAHIVSEDHDCPQVSIYSINGPIFFGTANIFERSIMELVDSESQIILLRIGKVPFIDTTGEARLSSIVKYFKSHGRKVVITGIQHQPKELLKRTGLYELISPQNFFDDSGEAIAYALTQINFKKCLGCKHYAFLECSLLSYDNNSDTNIEKKNELNKS